MMNDQEVAAMHERFAELQRQVRALRRVCGASLIVAVGIVAMTCSFNNFAPTSISVRDSAGRVRIELSAAGSTPWLHFLDSAGNTYASLETDPATGDPQLLFRCGRDYAITGTFGVTTIGASVDTLRNDEFQSSLTALSMSPVVMFTGPERGARIEFGQPKPRITFIDGDGNVTATVAEAK